MGRVVDGGLAEGDFYAQAGAERTLSIEQNWTNTEHASHLHSPDPRQI